MPPRPNRFVTKYEEVFERLQRKGVITNADPAVLRDVPVPVRLGVLEGIESLSLEYRFLFDVRPITLSTGHHPTDHSQAGYVNTNAELEFNLASEIFEFNSFASLQEARLEGRVLGRHEGVHHGHAQFKLSGWEIYFQDFFRDLSSPFAGKEQQTRLRSAMNDVIASSPVEVAAELVALRDNSSELGRGAHRAMDSFFGNGARARALREEHTKAPGKSIAELVKVNRNGQVGVRILDPMEEIGGFTDPLYVQTTTGHRYRIHGRQTIDVTRSDETKRLVVIDREDVNASSLSPLQPIAFASNAERPWNTASVQEMIVVGSGFERDPTVSATSNLVKDIEAQIYTLEARTRQSTASVEGDYLVVEMGRTGMTLEQLTDQFPHMHHFEIASSVGKITVEGGKAIRTTPTGEAVPMDVESTVVIDAEVTRFDKPPLSRSEMGVIARECNRVSRDPGLPSGGKPSAGLGF